MADELTGKKVAILVADGFEQIEMTSPREQLEKVGAITHLVSPSGDTVRGWNHDKPGDEFDVDVSVDDADAGNYDALFLPGGVMNPDKLRQNEKAVHFVRSFFEHSKPVGAICHGPWTLVEAGVVAGHTVTSYPSLKTDLRNAGAAWVDEQVVVDGNLVTSRQPDDLPAFNEKLCELVKQPQRQRKAA